MGVQNHLKIGEVPRENPVCYIWGFIFGPSIFLSFFGSPRNFLGSSFLPHFNHPITLYPEKPLVHFMSPVYY